MKKILRKAWSIIMWGVIACMTAIIICGLLFPNQTANIIGYKFYTILTDSMNPVIPPGSFVLSKVVKEDTELKSGDIVTFEGDRFGEVLTFTHYLKKIETDETGQKRYYTQGSTAKEYDPFTTYRGNIKGVYLFHVPYLGRVIEFLRSPFGLIEIAVIFLLLLNQHFLGKYFDAQDRLILRIEYQKKLQLRKVNIIIKKEYLKLEGVIYNPKKGAAISPCWLEIELLDKKEKVAETKKHLLPLLLAGDRIPWACETTQAKLVEDYRITILPISEEGEFEEQAIEADKETR